jgi:hypothetical protein
MLVLGYAILWTTEDEGTMERHARPLLREAPEQNVELTIEDIKDPVNENDAVAEAIGQSESDSDVNSDEETPEKAKEVETQGNNQGDKYNLNEYGSATENESEGQETSEPTSTTRQKQFLSAKQRRDLKKGSKSTVDEADDLDEVASSISNMSVSKSMSTPQIRGKKGKMKKIKAKYANQSDEERELARKILGAKETAKAVEKETPLHANEPKPEPVVKPSPQPAARPPKPIVEEALEVLFSVGLC